MVHTRVVREKKKNTENRSVPYGGAITNLLWGGDIIFVRSQLSEVAG